VKKLEVSGELKLKDAMLRAGVEFLKGGGGNKLLPLVRHLGCTVSSGYQIVFLHSMDARQPLLAFH